MLNDQRLAKAVSELRHRAERQEDPRKLIVSFVDLGILPQLLNTNHQILYGRRGAGKTHLFKVLASKFSEDPRNTVAYIDARTFGSTSQFSDSEVPLPTRCVCLFRDFLSEVHDALLNHIVNQPSEQAEQALSALEQLGQAMISPARQYQTENISTRLQGKVTTQDGVDVSLGTKEGLRVGILDRLEQATEREDTTSYTVTLEDKIVFPAVSALTHEVLEKAQARLYVLLDEWSSLPMEIQPYFAEFLKRSFLPNPMVIVKIASLEYKSTFSLRTASNDLGFEVGSDVSSALDMDDHYVYDRHPEKVTSAFADVLYRHLNSELPAAYLAETYSVTSADKVISALFAGRVSFKELVRASEGVIRDLIHVFSRAFFLAKGRGKEVIEQKDVMESARQWFELDKGKNLDPEMIRALEKIVNEVIGHHRVRSFMVSRELEKHPVIQRLFDLRILHLTKRGLMDTSNPGRRYNVYSLDYATYVDLVNAPEVGFKRVPGDVPHGFVVPFGDKRAIRKVILTANVLEP